MNLNPFVFLIYMIKRAPPAGGYEALAKGMSNGVNLNHLLNSSGCVTDARDPFDISKYHLQQTVLEIWFYIAAECFLDKKSGNIAYILSYKQIEFIKRALLKVLVKEEQEGQAVQLQSGLSDIEKFKDNKSLQQYYLKKEWECRVIVMSFFVGCVCTALRCHKVAIPIVLGILSVALFCAIRLSLYKKKQLCQERMQTAFGAACKLLIEIVDLARERNGLQRIFANYQVVPLPSAKELPDDVIIDPTSEMFLIHQVQI